VKYRGIRIYELRVQELGCYEKNTQTLSPRMLLSILDEGEPGKETEGEKPARWQED
jgi:hypothetical protein